MPVATINGIALYYEVHGQGDPLLMIKGLGHSAKLWLCQVPYLSRYFRTIIYDSRGVGRSDKPVVPYSIADEGAEAVGLLDFLGIERAHVLGVSRGGYVAQEIAIGFPERVDKLVLLVTSCGGPEYLAATQEIWARVLDVTGLTRAEIYRQGVRYSTTPEFFDQQPELVDRLVSLRMEDPQPLHAFKLQFDSASAFDARDRARHIRAPTLVIGGRQDQIVPLAFVRHLAAQIPGARLQVVDKAGHLAFIEQSDTVNRAVKAFLEEP